MLEPGSTLPDLELPDHASRDRRLSELVAADPTIVRFLRARSPRPRADAHLALPAARPPRP